MLTIIRRFRFPLMLPIVTATGFIAVVIGITGPSNYPGQAMPLEISAATQHPELDEKALQQLQEEYLRESREAERRMQQYLLKQRNPIKPAVFIQPAQPDDAKPRKYSI